MISFTIKKDKAVATTSLMMLLYCSRQMVCFVRVIWLCIVNKKTEVIPRAFVVTVAVAAVFNIGSGSVVLYQSRRDSINGPVACCIVVVWMIPMVSFTRLHFQKRETGTLRYNNYYNYYSDDFILHAQR